MKYFVLISIILLYLQFNRIETKKLIDAVKIVKSINDNPDLPWKADTYGQKQVDEELFARTKLGAILDTKDAPSFKAPKELVSLAQAPPPDASDRDAIGLPVNFTWADPAVTKCPTRHIRDQSNCGSCWAVATASAFGDRFCIKTNGRIMTNFSQEFVTSCNLDNRGCRGGRMDIVNDFMVKVGTITGGDYDSDEGCQMYTVRPCNSPRQISMFCSYNTAITPKCKRRKCNNDWYNLKEEKEANFFKAKSWYFVRSNITHSREDRIREEIYKNGPVTAGFLVPADFIYYKKGVYVPGRSWIIGAHAVRVVGWGVENGVKYWHAANSWTKYWGETGFFKIIRGVNALMFENWISAWEPKL